MTKRALRLLAAVTSLVGMGAGQAGVVAQWHFDEADGAIARDSLGSLDGALSATGATFVPGGIAGNAIRLDGTQNGWVSMGNALGLTNGDFSIVLWVKTTATEGDTVVLGKHEAFSENGYFFAINPTGGGGAPDKATFVVSEFVRDGVTSSASVNDGNWHQLVGVYQAGGSERIYVDGALAATGASEPVVLNNAPFLIGGISVHGVATGRFTGLVDEVQVYDRTLSNAEVQNLFAYPAQTLASPRGEALVPGSIVYSRTTGSDGSIWAFDPATGRDTYLMEGTRPRLSPDGRYVAYLRDNGALAGHGNVYVRDLAEGSERMLHENHDYVIGVSFADEGRQVLFDAECSILQVARSGAVPITLVSGHCWDDSPAADPFTGRIAFHNLSLRQIGTANAYGTGKHYLPPASGEDVYPTWSPDGQWILVANADSIQMQRGPGNLVKLRPDGSDRTVLTFVSGANAGFRANAVWTLDGLQILGAGKPEDRNGIFRVDANGGGIIERLDTLPGDDIDWVGGIVPDSPITRGLVAWWRAEGNGRDSAGPHHASGAPAIAYAAQSKLGQAFDFTGGTHLEVPDAPTLHFVRFTTAAWVNFRSATRVQGILSKATQPGAPESFALWYADGQLRGRAGGPSPDAPAVAVAFNPAPGAWYHVAYRFDGETNALFLDGALVASTASNIAPEYTSQHLLIGARDQAGAPTDVFDGMLDEVRLYSRALSDQEVGLLRRQEHTRIQVALDPQLPEPLTLSWPADDPGVLVETVAGLGGVETWLPIERRPVQVGATEILHLPLSGVLGEGNSRFWRMTLLQEGVQLFPVALTVRNLNDSFAGSLRQAISDARSGDAIVFAPGLTGTIKLTSGQLVINKDLKIIGPGAKVVTADAQGLSGVFQIDDRSVVTLVGLTIMGGKAAAGGGIVVFGTLTMRDCVLRNNTAAGYGGGIVTDRGATCVIQDCTISDNSAGNYGGGTAFGPGQVSLENCTLAGNRAGIGGGIYAYNCKLKVLSTTVCGNSASSDAAIWLQGSLTAVQVSNSIIAGNAGVAGVGECFGSFLSLGYNLIGTAGLSTGWGATGDQVGTVANPLDPKLGPLQDNGGPTPTMAPLPGSKAIDQGRRNGLSTDQRGRPRPKNFPSIPDANYGDGSDIGAVEVQ